MIEHEDVLEWAKENQFWAISAVIALVCLVFILYQFMMSRVQTLKQDTDEQLSELRDRVQFTEKPQNRNRVLGDKRLIPPKKVVKEYKQKNRNFADQLWKVAVFYLERGRAIERWFQQNRNPNSGFFGTQYNVHRKELNEQLQANNVKVKKAKKEGGLFGGGGEQASTAIDWADNPGENMRTSQKRFWMIKRIVEDVIRSGVSEIGNLSFSGMARPILIQGLDGSRSEEQKSLLLGSYSDDQSGAILAERHSVSVEVTLSPNQIGSFLIALQSLGKETPEERTNLMMYIRNYQINKTMTTAGTVTDQPFTFTTRLQVHKDFWKQNPNDDELREKLAIKQLSKRSRPPYQVDLTVDLIVLDVHEPTVARMLTTASKLLDKSDGAIREVFDRTTPFFTQDELNTFLQEQ